MGKTIGQFDYLIRKPEIGGTPLPATVHIILGDHAIDEDGQLLLSPSLSEQEIDGHVLELKKDLDRVGRLAKRALKRANQET